MALQMKTKCPKEGMYLYNTIEDYIADGCVYVPDFVDLSIFIDVDEEFKREWEERHKPQE